MWQHMFCVSVMRAVWNLKFEKKKKRLSQLGYSITVYYDDSVG